MDGIVPELLQYGAPIWKRINHFLLNSHSNYNGLVTMNDAHTIKDYSIKCNLMNDVHNRRLFYQMQLTEHEKQLNRHTYKKITKHNINY